MQKNEIVRSLQNVFMYTRECGLVVAGRCTTHVRKLRFRLPVCAIAFSALLIISVWLASGPHASGGLVGAPLDPAFGQVNEVGMIPDYGNQTSLDNLRLVTALSFIIVSFVPMDKRKNAPVRRVVLELIGLASVPIVVHLIGTFMIDNFGGICGGV